MYQNVYIDAVFAANFLMDYILLRLTGFFIREGRNRRRCLMAAAGGALFSSISLCIPADQIPRLWSIGQIFCAAGIIRLAYPIRSWKRLAMAVLIFYVLAFLSGGIWTEVMGNTRTTGVIFVLCAFGTYLGISIVIHLLDVTEHVRSGSYPVVLKYCGREQQDTGIRRHRKSACRSGERYSGFYCVMGTYGNAFAGRFDRKTCMSAGKA